MLEDRGGHKRRMPRQLRVAHDKRAREQLKGSSCGCRPTRRISLISTTRYVEVRPPATPIGSRTGMRVLGVKSRYQRMRPALRGSGSLKRVCVYMHTYHIIYHKHLCCLISYALEGEWLPTGWFCLPPAYRRFATVLPARRRAEAPRVAAPPHARLSSHRLCFRRWGAARPFSASRRSMTLPPERLSPMPSKIVLEHTLSRRRGIRRGVVHVPQRAHNIVIIAAEDAAWTR